VVRVIEMPAMPDDELAGAIRFSAVDHIPIPLDEAVLDHAVLETLPPAEPGGPPQVRVLIAAAHRSTLDSLMATVSAGGLRAVAVDLVPIALVRGLRHAGGAPHHPGAGPLPSGHPAAEPWPNPAAEGDGPPAAEAIVSVGAGLTTVIVHEDGLPRFVRTVAAGGDMLTVAIGEELGVGPEAAEEAKRAAGSAADADDLARRAARVVELRLAGILGEIQSSLAYWMAQSERPLQRIILTGGGARAGDVAGRLALLVGAPVEWSSVQRLEAPEAALGAGDWPDLAVAAGLALGGADRGGWRIDLCPPQKRKLRFDRQLATRLGAVAAVVFVVLGGLSVKSVLAIRAARHDLAVQQKTNRGVETELASYDSLRKLSADLDTSRKRVQGALNGDVSWTRFLSDFVNDMPEGAWISSINAQTTTPGKAAAPVASTVPKPGAATSTGIGTVQWAVTGVDYPAAADWLRKLSDDPALAGVSIGALNKAEIGARSVVSFSSNATITPAARSDRASRLAKAAL
jgi:type IV pilus assembly protein PilM